MPCVDADGETIVREAQALLAQIDQVARWLPAREPRRRDLLNDIAAMELQVARETPSGGAIHNLQLQVSGLNGSPLRALLNRRVAEFSQLYGVMISPRRS